MTTTYHAAAWRDPTTGRVNLALTRQTRDGEHIDREAAAGFDWNPRTIAYDTVDDDLPTPVTVALAVDEAGVIFHALERILR